MNAKAGREAWRSMLDVFFSGHVSARMQQACTALGIAPGVLKLLLKLDLGLAVPMRDLADHWGFDASYVTSLADALEERGLVERRPHPTDRRVKMLAITQKGVQARAAAYELLYEPPPSFGALTAAEQRELRNLLRKVVDADVESARPRAAAGR
jgi:DNA-binding MarR family transcriptional regulator